jgi:hypothetical protein
MQHSTRARRRATSNMHQTACSMRQPMCNMRQTMCNMGHATDNKRHDSIRHAACNTQMGLASCSTQLQHSTCSLQLVVTVADNCSSLSVILMQRIATGRRVLLCAARHRIVTCTLSAACVGHFCTPHVPQHWRQITPMVPSAVRVPTRTIADFRGSSLATLMVFTEQLSRRMRYPRRRVS